jgi:hypothetical protein
VSAVNEGECCGREGEVIRRVEDWDGWLEVDIPMKRRRRVLVEGCCKGERVEEESEES